MEFADKQITCSDCQKPFTFTAGEQRWYQEKGFEREPRRCPDCRKAKKGRDDGGGRHHGGSRGERGDRPKFRVKCSQCGADAEVPFQPRSGAPVYCSTCFQARRA